MKNFLFSEFDFLTIPEANALVILKDIVLDDVYFYKSDFLSEISSD